MDGKKTREQLRAFNDGLREYGCGQRTIPKDWSEAFARLRELLRSGAAVRELGTGRLVVFLDELPWMDTARSDFRTALDHFWNTWGSAQPDLLLIVCGSATSWMISNLIDDHGGFNNRVTRQISLAPFTRAELERREAIGGGQPPTKALRELEQCGFLRKHRDFTKAKNGGVYQLVDPFSLFHLCFIEPNEFDSWISFQGMPRHTAWRGHAFELVCLLHAAQMKRALGISGMQTSECAWRSTKSSPAAQIDLLIDRRDDVINVCEMKFARGE